MTILKTLLISCVLSLLLTACNQKHGYEGEYKFEQSASIDAVDEAMGVLMELLGGNGAQLVVIGPDYIEVEGKRTTFDKIYAKKSGSQSFLVFVDNGKEEIWKIESDGQVLTQNAGFFQLRMRRVDDL